MTIRLNSPQSSVLITGGASGLGRASAEAVAEVGRPVAIWDLDPAKSQQVAAEIADRFKVQTFGIGIDLRDPAAIEPALVATRQALPGIGAMVHAAGVVLNKPVDEVDADNWDAVLDVNLRAFPLLIRAMLPDLRANSGSAIVGIASINATLGNGLIPAYTASKGGMLSVTRSLADSLGRDGIRINSVSPGQILTPMLKPSVDALPEGAFEQRILLGRLGDPAEIGRVVRFLLSDEASYMTGSEVVVDGGNISSQR